MTKKEINKHKYKNKNDRINGIIEQVITLRKNGFLDFTKFWFYYMLCSIIDIFYKIFDISSIIHFFNFLSGSTSNDDIYEKRMPLRIIKKK